MHFNFTEKLDEVKGCVCSFCKTCVRNILHSMGQERIFVLALPSQPVGILFQFDRSKQQQVQLCTALRAAVGRRRSRRPSPGCRRAPDARPAAWTARRRLQLGLDSERALSSRHVPRAAARRGKNKSRSPAGRRGAQARCGGEHRCVAAAQFGTPIGGGTSASDLPWIGGLSAVDRWWIGGGSKVDRWWIDVGSVAQVCSRAKQKNSAPPAELAGEAEGRPDSDGPCERA